MDSLSVIIKSFIATFKSPKTAVKLISERVLPALQSPNKVAADLSMRQDVGYEYGLDTGTKTLTIANIILFIVQIIVMFMVAGSFASPDGTYSMVLMATIVGGLISIPISVVVSLLIAYIGIWVIWWVGKKLGGQAAFERFFGTLMPAVCLMFLLQSAASIIISFIFAAGFSSMDYTNMIDLYMPSMIVSFALYVITLAYLTVFSGKAHGIPQDKAFLSSFAAMVPVFLYLIFQYMVFTTVSMT